MSVPLCGASSPTWRCVLLVTLPSSITCSTCRKDSIKRSELARRDGAQIGVLQKLGWPEGGRAKRVHGIHPETDEHVEFASGGVEVEVHGHARVGARD